MNRMAVILAIVASCSSRPKPNFPIPTPPNPDSTDSAPPEVVLPDQKNWLAPSVQLYGQPNQSIYNDFHALPAFGGHPGTLFIQSGSQPKPYPQTFSEYPMMFVLPGVLPRGRHEIADVWDGAGGADFLDGFVTAGDVDGDGHMDMWCANRRLYLGPFVGKLLHIKDSVAELECCTTPMLGNFDADGDGVFDLLAGGGQIGDLHHGPFKGLVPIWTKDPEVTMFGFEDGGCPNGRGAHLVRDYFGPGDDLVGIGAPPSDTCSPDTYFYRLRGPRGRRLTHADAVSTAEISTSFITYYSGLDVDNDGRSEVVAGRDFKYVYDNPLDPWFYNTPRAWELGDEDRIYAPVGDVNGDGLGDMVAWVDTAHGSGGSWFGLVLAPFDTSKPLIHNAIPLLDANRRMDGEPIPYEGAGRIAMDLDGDGLSDLINLETGPEWEGYISIWYGSDIVAHIEAYNEAKEGGS